MDLNGNGGGLALLWGKGVFDVYRELFQKSYPFSCWVPETEQPPWLFTGIYGHPETQNKYLTWELMKSLRNTIGSCQWLICGDFNEVVDHNEKWRGWRKIESKLEAFKEAISQCALQDLGFSGLQCCVEVPIPEGLNSEWHRSTLRPSSNLE